MSKKSVMALSVLLLGGMSAGAGASEIYTWTDAQGNRIYSDQPNPNSTKIEVGPTNSIEPPKPIPAFNEASNGANNQSNANITGGYRSLKVTSPANDSAVRANDGNITLSVTIDPPLRSGNLLRAQVDGNLNEQAIAGSGQPNATLTLPNLDRGTHEISAVIMDTKGQVILSSDPVTLHVQRTSLNQPGRVGNPNQAPTAPAAPRAPNVPGPTTGN
ncbi:DUF4124 domain-containing protein [Pseudomonas sp. 5Ae-yellow]|uniref:DUF4124 domain-containing protein n=1 Tax=Pseudomonas sp. 5Ae-yellow TaxID=2759848 RepID=UPI000C8CA1B5|nr:DUF4124 domain-containing protein [Pseudomonas sp. 5Ae-yellow]MAB24343.1 hypothetical protein [Pseudomonadales bacterium]MBA6419104.1 DUF4124 domain-containing protein [Pseudomonas sp. 5Ae-yellow]|tara:strand:+ start:8056 stop:8703 length:648 start_codon:yes stop_codon:yes gene_type:complete